MPRTPRKRLSSRASRGDDPCLSQQMLKNAKQDTDETSGQDRGRKRKEPVEHGARGHHRQKRPRISASNYPIAYWSRNQCWPEDWPEEAYTMNDFLARKKTLSSLSRKRSNSNSSTVADQEQKEEKSAPYRDPRYEALLELRGSYMREDSRGPTDDSLALCQSLLQNEQQVPEGTLFRDDIFRKTCQSIQSRNEARVIQDISRLIVPSAETLAIFGAKHLGILTESVNDAWTNSVPVVGTRPQPDYAVGFRRDAFSEDQLSRLSPFVGNFVAGDQSWFMATYYMYFPFLACEVKCSTAGLDTADRQNAHSMTVAVRAVVELFRAVGRVVETDRKILAFSISHDHRSVRIYGHYPVLTGKDTKYYRYTIRTFDFTELGGREKWTAYQFTKNIYDSWVPEHFKNICSAIDQLPLHLDLELTGLSQESCSQSSAGHHKAEKKRRE
ncbi:hypothetical protein VTO42DRAFT_3788 [Malbranchea cinnamomea]